MPAIKTGRYRSISKTSMPGVRAKTGRLLAKQRANLAQARHNLDVIMEHIEKEFGPEALEAVLSVIQNVAKNPARPGAWRDRTGNLRDSIMVEILKPNEVKILNYRHGRTVGKNDTKMILGLLFAGMEYGAALETRPGYSVLGYAVESLKRRMTPLLAQKLKLTGKSERY
jgi:plasmid stabilization system protein ParE